MKITLMVQDAIYEMGHSKAMFETIRLLPQELKIEEIKIVSYRFSPLEQLLPNINIPVTYVKVPPMPLRPFLVRDIFYQIYSIFYFWFFKKKDEYIIGIGTSALYQDICDIQWIHHQWSPVYLKLFCPKGLLGIYKKLLHWYGLFIEKTFFRSKTRHYLCLSRFIHDYLEKTFSIDKKNLHLAYSSVNTEKFKLSGKSRKEIHQILIEQYPVLKQLDTNRPIILFAGALERKGYFDIIKFINQSSDTYQLIAIGEGEFSSVVQETVTAPQSTLFRINHTKSIEQFYELSDMFLFPSLYDPFGLVVIEAWAMGLDVVVPKGQVGASELIDSSEGVLCYDANEGIPNIAPKIIGIEEKLQRCHDRVPLLTKYSWENKAKLLATLLKGIDAK